MSEIQGESLEQCGMIGKLMETPHPESSSGSMFQLRSLLQNLGRYGDDNEAAQRLSKWLITNWPHGILYPTKDLFKCIAMVLSPTDRDPVIGQPLILIDKCSIKSKESC